MLWASSSRLVALPISWTALVTAGSLCVAQQDGCSKMTSHPIPGRPGPTSDLLLDSERAYLLTLTSPTGTRESAFVYALSAATISHTIARACTSGDLPGCSCGPVPGEPPGPGNRWGGCADNLSYGLLMGAKFSDAPMKVKKTGSQANKLMRLHNSEVGRQVTTPTRPEGVPGPLAGEGPEWAPQGGGRGDGLGPCCSSSLELGLTCPFSLS